MCCLPNKFPLPIYLVINKIDTLQTKENLDEWIQRSKVKDYSEMNQFIDYFLISTLHGKGNSEGKSMDQEKAENDLDDRNTSSEQISKHTSRDPIFKIVEFVFSFEDLRDKLLSADKSVLKKSRTKESKDTNKKDKCLVL